MPKGLFLNNGRPTHFSGLYEANFTLMKCSIMNSLYSFIEVQGRICYSPSLRIKVAWKINKDFEFKNFEKFCNFYSFYQYFLFITINSKKTKVT